MSPLVRRHRPRARRVAHSPRTRRSPPYPHPPSRTPISPSSAGASIRTSSSKSTPPFPTSPQAFPSVLSLSMSPTPPNPPAWAAAALHHPPPDFRLLPEPQPQQLRQRLPPRRSHVVFSTNGDQGIQRTSRASSSPSTTPSEPTSPDNPAATPATPPQPPPIHRNRPQLLHPLHARLLPTPMGWQIPHPHLRRQRNRRRHPPHSFPPNTPPPPSPPPILHTPLPARLHESIIP